MLMFTEHSTGADRGFISAEKNESSNSMKEICFPPKHWAKKHKGSQILWITEPEVYL